MDKIKLLVADDEPDLLAELKPLLQRSGYEVVTAEGYVVPQKAANDWALLILYGAPNDTEEDAVMLRLP